MIQDRPKAVRDGYAPAPFFFCQTTDRGDTRLVAWTGTVLSQRTVLEALVLQLPSRVELVLKVWLESDDLVDESGAMVAEWRRYDGVASRGALLEALSRCEGLIFRDGRSQLCVRHPRTRDYIVFDEYGVFYVYSNAPAFRAVFVTHGFVEREEPLIADGTCWRTQPPDGRAAEAEFVRLLRLEPMPAPGAAHPSSAVH
ncbi:MAG: hypothetical protein R2752_09785 [Vicinamibacterales bacterium]